MALAAVLGSPALAQDRAAQGLTIEEVIVTAEKRETNVQSTPIAISAISGAALERRQINDVVALAQAMPGVIFGQTLGNARISIRGIGYENISQGGEARVAFHQDGIYMSRPAGQLSGLYDVDRIEVLRGPQGTLYGRNATAGAVNLITKDPTNTFQGTVALALGNYGLKHLNGAISGPFSGNLSGRIAFNIVDRGGYGRDITTNEAIDDESHQAVRGKVKWDINDNWTAKVSADYFRENDAAYGYHYLGVGAPTAGITPRMLVVGAKFAPNVRDIAAEETPHNRREFYGAGIDLTGHLGEIKVESIFGYRHVEWQQDTDLDVTSLPWSHLRGTENSDQYTEELRFSQSLERIDWQFGLYYFNEDLFASSRNGSDRGLSITPWVGRTTFMVNGFFAGGYDKTVAWAGFGNVKYRVTEQLSLNVGGRYSHEKKSIIEGGGSDLSTPYPPFAPGPATTPGIPTFFFSTGRIREDSAKWKSFDPSASLEYKPTDHQFLYATVSSGFKAGGFNMGALRGAFLPESITSYEVGYKADWLDGRLRTNFAAFDYKYTNMQVSKILNQVLIIENAGASSIKGMEADTIAVLSPALRLDASATYVDAKYTSYKSIDPVRASLGELDLAGNRMLQAPKFTSNVGLEYSMSAGPGNLVLRGEMRYTSLFYFTQFNLPWLSQPAQAKFNAFATYTSPSDKYSISAFVRNLTDKSTIAAVQVGSATLGSPLNGTLQPPRTFGVEFRSNF